MNRLIRLGALLSLGSLLLLSRPAEALGLFSLSYSSTSYVNGLSAGVTEFELGVETKGVALELRGYSSVMTYGLRVRGQTAGDVAYSSPWGVGTGRLAEVAPLSFDLGPSLSTQRLLALFGVFPSVPPEVDAGLSVTVGLGGLVMLNDGYDEGIFFLLPLRTQLYLRFYSMALTVSVSKEFRMDLEFEEPRGGWPLVWDIGLAVAFGDPA